MFSMEIADYIWTESFVFYDIIKMKSWIAGTEYTLKEPVFWLYNGETLKFHMWLKNQKEERY